MKRIAFRCSLCGEFVFGNPIDDMPDAQMAVFCRKFVRNQEFVSNPYLQQAPMHTVHNCADGSCGIAYFAGIKKEN